MNSPIPKKELMRRLREERKQKGIVKIEFNVRQEHVERIRKYVQRIEKKNE